MKTVEHFSCRLCGSEDWERIHDFGNFFVSNFVDEQDIYTGPRAPLDLFMCNSCSLIQLRHTAPMELMYSGHYWYRSGVTQTMRDALKEVATIAVKLANLRPGDAVLDIGANDGTLLASLPVDGLIRLGCEPAKNMVEALSSNCEHVIHNFWNKEDYITLSKQHGFGKAKLITALGMFYDLEDPNQFIADAVACLSEDGVFIAQLMCLENMLRQNDLGNICHEHIEYYSLDSLKYLFENNGLEMFHIEENDVNGGSYRIFCRHFNNSGIKYDEKITRADLTAFIDRIDKNRDQCVEFVKSEVAKGRKVYVYGASTKGNTILQYYGLDHSLITAAAERSPEKWGKFTVGTGIPIVSEEEAREAQPDYFLVLPWAFVNEFYEREREWRAKGGKFIVPLKNFEILD